MSDLDGYSEYVGTKRQTNYYNDVNNDSESDTYSSCLHTFVDCVAGCVSEKPCIESCIIDAIGCVVQEHRKSEEKGEAKFDVWSGCGYNPFCVFSNFLDGSSL